jgi:hypothetical protein
MSTFIDYEEYDRLLQTDLNLEAQEIDDAEYEAGY